MNAPALEHCRLSFLTYIRVECGLSSNTVEAYGRDLRDLIAALAQSSIFSPDQLTPRDLALHIGSLRRERGLNASSVTRHLATIRMFCRWLAVERLAPANLTDWLERPSKWQRLPGVMTPANIQKLINAPQPPTLEDIRAGRGLPLWLRDRAILELMYACGLRASEVGALGLRDPDFHLNVVKVTGKGNKQRLVPFGVPAADTMRGYLADCRPMLLRDDGRDGARLFISRTGRPLERVAIWQIVKRNAELAGISGVHPHLLRHTFATHVLTGGADLRVVQEFLGHANITTTQVYTRVDQPRLKEVHRRFHPRA
jgi:integrase/recombinase XerD